MSLLCVETLRSKANSLAVASHSEFNRARIETIKPVWPARITYRMSHGRHGYLERLVQIDAVALISPNRAGECLGLGGGIEAELANGREQWLKDLLKTLRTRPSHNGFIVSISG